MGTTARDIALLVGAAFLVGLVAGLAMATQSLRIFSPVPGPILFGAVLLAGVGLGSLVRSLAQVLLAVIVTVVVSMIVMASALVYPEMGPEAALGVEAALTSALRIAVISGFFFVLPLTLIGAMFGRLFSRHEQ